MTKLIITNKKPYTNKAGEKVVQVETFLADIVSEDATYINFDVTEIISVENKPSFYEPTQGGSIAKRFLANYTGKVGMMTIAVA